MSAKGAGGAGHVVVGVFVVIVAVVWRPCLLFRHRWAASFWLISSFLSVHVRHMFAQLPLSMSSAQNQLRWCGYSVHLYPSSVVLLLYLVSCI